MRHGQLAPLRLRLLLVLTLLVRAAAGLSVRGVPGGLLLWRHVVVRHGQEAARHLAAQGQQRRLLLLLHHGGSRGGAVGHGQAAEVGGSGRG